MLNTSLPHIHNDLLGHRRRAKEAGEDPDFVFHPPQLLPPSPSGDSSPPIPEAKIDPKTKRLLVRTKEEQEATSRALKPHSRSTAAMSELRAQRDRPEGMAVLPPGGPTQPKSKARKWQFGIRSRNAPYEAMKCLYNALKAQSGEWEVIPALSLEGEPNNEEERDSLPPPPPELAEGERHTVLQSRFPHMPNDYYVPRDPWFIRARMLKKGMYAPGEAPVLSANNSSVNLAEHHLRKQVEQHGGYLSEEFSGSLAGNGSSSKPNSQPGSAQATRPSSSIGEHAHFGDASFTGPGQLPSRSGSTMSAPGRDPNPNIGVWVFIDIQLYMLETNNYMVDFKCDGYQNVIFVPRSRGHDTGSSSQVSSPTPSRPTSGLGSQRLGDSMIGEYEEGVPLAGNRGEWKAVSKRVKNKEKEITSPYPYLDVASDLIAQLAVAN